MGESDEDLAELLVDTAHHMVAEDTDIFKIVIVEHPRTAEILTKLLVRILCIPNNHNTRLDITARLRKSSYAV